MPLRVCLNGVDWYDGTALQWTYYVAPHVDVLQPWGGPLAGGTLLSLRDAHMAAVGINSTHSMCMLGNASSNATRSSSFSFFWRVMTSCIACRYRSSACSFSFALATSVWSFWQVLYKSLSSSASSFAIYAWTALER